MVHTYRQLNRHELEFLHLFLHVAEDDGSVVVTEEEYWCSFSLPLDSDLMDPWDSASLELCFIMAIANK